MYDKIKNFYFGSVPFRKVLIPHGELVFNGTERNKVDIFDIILLVRTVFEPGLDTVKTNILTKFHRYWVKYVSSIVFIRTS